MAENNNVVSASEANEPLQDTVVTLDQVPGTKERGCKVHVHFNGPTEQLSGMCTGMAVLDPGASPHPPHQHPEEEFMIVAEGTGEIECNGKTTQVGPGSIMYCDGNVMHGIINTGRVPMTFYWSKWLAK